MNSKIDPWAQALAEAEDPQRRDAGLWARCYAQADGDESKTKAAYIRARVDEQEKPTPPPALKPAKTPGWCPNCGTECDSDAPECPKCKSSFAADSAFKLLAAAPSNAKPRISKPQERGWCPVCHEALDLDAVYCSACHSSLSARGLTPLKYKPTSTPHTVQQTYGQGPQVIKTAKSRGVYIILGLFFGMLGIHNFYAGRFLRGALQFIVTAALGWFVIGLVITCIWALIDLFTVTTDGAGDAMA